MKSRRLGLSSMGATKCRLVWNTPKNQPAMGERVVCRDLSYVRLECLHNFEATARILQKGNLTFRTIFDFNELRVTKISQSTTLAP
jgi:hypothetical protein